MSTFKIWKASEYLGKEHKIFSYIVSKAYEITEESDKDYKERFTWYWKKVVPDIIRGTRNIFLAIIDDDIAGCAILKGEETEKKICTLFVLDEYRNNGIATALLEESFKFLGTTTPLITIPEYKVSMFVPIIRKYDWRRTQIIEKGFYSNHSREFVFNGKIS